MCVICAVCTLKNFNTVCVSFIVDILLDYFWQNNSRAHCEILFHFSFVSWLFAKDIIWQCKLMRDKEIGYFLFRLSNLNCKVFVCLFSSKVLQVN